MLSNDEKTRTRKYVTNWQERTILGVVVPKACGYNDRADCVTIFLIDRNTIMTDTALEALCAVHGGVVKIRNFTNARLCERRLISARVPFKRVVLNGKAYSEYAIGSDGTRSAEIEKAVCRELGYRWTGGLRGSRGGQNRDGVNHTLADDFLEVKGNRGRMELG